MPNPKPVALEQVLGHVFNDARLLEQSLTHSSLSYERASGRGPANPSETRRHGPGKPGADHDNEQLEFLGDAVLGLVVADFLFRSYRTLNEGDLTRLRAQLVSRKHLGHVAARLSLGDYMRLGRGEERSGGRQKAVLLANALEAVIAALYIDGGLQTASGFIAEHIVRPYVDELHAALEAGHAMGDHKSALQEWLQSHKLPPASYSVKGESGPDHRKRFLVELRVDRAEGLGHGTIVTHGSGSTKKKAEQDAARRALAALVDGVMHGKVDPHETPEKAPILEGVPVGECAGKVS